MSVLLHTHTPCSYLVHVAIIYYATFWDKRLSYTIYNKKYFSDGHFSYPNLEGIKDTLSYKFRRLTIGTWSELLCRVHKQGCHGLGAIETHSRLTANSAKRCAFRETCSAGHRASSEAKGEVCSLS